VQDICDRIMRKSRSSVIGLDVGKGLRDSMIVSGTSSCIPIIGRISVKAVRSRSREWMRSTGIVRHFLFFSRCILFLTLTSLVVVRSEGGSECHKALSASGGGTYLDQPPPLPVPKTEVDGGWGIVL
jgi:hypothetical protein